MIIVPLPVGWTEAVLLSAALMLLFYLPDYLPGAASEAGRIYGKYVRKT